jgi:hypothetical protein
MLSITKQHINKHNQNLYQSDEESGAAGRKKEEVCADPEFLFVSICYWVKHGFLDGFMNDRRTHFFNYLDGKITPERWVCITFVLPG